MSSRGHVLRVAVIANHFRSRTRQVSTQSRRAQLPIRLFPSLGPLTSAVGNEDAARGTVTANEVGDFVRTPSHGSRTNKRGHLRPATRVRVRVKSRTRIHVIQKWPPDRPRHLQHARRRPQEGRGPRARPRARSTRVSRVPLDHESSSFHVRGSADGRRSLVTSHMGQPRSILSTSKRSRPWPLASLGLVVG